MSGTTNEDTVRLHRRPAGRRRVLAILGVIVLLLGGGTAVWLLRPPPPVPHQAPPPVVTAPSIPIQTATEGEIRAFAAAALTVFRFAGNPYVIVLDFPGLEQQGLMLNRVAALVEKEGLPRDRVLTDAELDAAIRAHGDTVATYYYGHDYSAADLARFFTLADRQQLHLNPQEEWLHGLLRQLGWLTPGAQGGLISIPPVDPGEKITASARASILRHELAHGEFFSDPAYAAYTRTFWRSALTEQERAAVRSFLGSEEYDTSDDELMLNEMQAYLMFTSDPAFFQPELIGMTPARLAELQAAFRQNLPVGWMRTAMEHPSASASR